MKSFALTLQSLFFLFLAKKAKKARSPEKNKDFPMCRTPITLGNESKNAQKSEGKSQNEEGKDKKARIGGSGWGTLKN